MPGPLSSDDRLLRFYDGASQWLKPAVESVSANADSAIAGGRERFSAMRSELPYVDRPDHTMASSVFACAVMLSVFEELRDQGVDAHVFGSAILDLPAVAPGEEDEEARGMAAADAEASQSHAAPNEFVFELLGADDSSDRGMNIRSCAICHLFAKHDAMELVPYMCAFDDVTSDAGDQGLRRTGTIALGASHCDFRFKQGAEPLRLSAQYPEQIRLRQS
jgi:hypothetical protein